MALLSESYKNRIKRLAGIIQEINEENINDYCITIKFLYNGKILEHDGIKGHNSQEAIDNLRKDIIKNAQKYGYDPAIEVINVVEYPKRPKDYNPFANG